MVFAEQNEQNDKKTIITTLINIGKKSYATTHYKSRFKIMGGKVVQRQENKKRVIKETTRNHNETDETQLF